MIKFIILCAAWFILGIPLGWHLCKKFSEYTVDIEIPEDATDEEVVKIIERYFNEKDKD